MPELPFPSNEKWESHAAVSPKQDNAAGDKPWQKLSTGEPMPMMFKLLFRNGAEIYYPYSDLREIRVRDAGHVQLMVFGMDKYQIDIQGRHLGELITLLAMGRAKSLEESGPQSFTRPESLPSIDMLTVTPAS